jgi:hypothetical protein
VIDFGVRLQLLVGATIPRPAPYAVVDALETVEVTNRDTERDGFQLTFHVGKDSLVDYALLRDGTFEPPAAVSIVIIFGGGPQVLVNGVVTDLQLTPTNSPGESTLVVSGDDASFTMDQDERTAVFRNQSDSEIVESILGTYGLQPDVSSTSDRPSDQDRVVSQQDTDLGFVQALAARNGFVFFVEPTVLPGRSRAYWGPERRDGPPQRALIVSAGPDANVDEPVVFDYNALGPTSPQVTILEPRTGLRVQVPAPAELLSALSGRPAKPLRTVVARDTAKLDPVQAALRALATSTSAADAGSARGELDAVRYGRALQSRRLVDVAGAGNTNSGTYYVQEVTHRLQRGSYRQTFVLSREGRGAASLRVAT